MTTGMPRASRGQYGAADPLGAGHRAARRIDPDDQRLDVAMLEPALEVAGDRVAAGGAGRGVAVDDRAGDGQHRDLAARAARRMIVDPGAVMDRAVAARHVVIVGAGKLGHAPAEGGAVADMVDQAGVERRPRHVAAGGGDESRRVGDISGDLRPRPRLVDVLLPAPPQGVGERLAGLARLGRHVVARIGLDRRLERADAIDVGGDAEPLEQAGIIEIGAARAGDQHRAERIEPDLVGMGGELVAVVIIAGRISDDALVGAAEAVERGADVGDRGLAAAGEAVEVERDRLDMVVGRPLRRAHGRARSPDIRGSGWCRRRSRSSGLRTEGCSTIAPARSRPQRAAAGAAAMGAGRQERHRGRRRRSA